MCIRCVLCELALLDSWNCTYAVGCLFSTRLSRDVLCARVFLLPRKSNFEARRLRLARGVLGIEHCSSAGLCASVSTSEITIETGVLASVGVKGVPGSIGDTAVEHGAE